jgi:hypothetical protein
MGEKVVEVEKVEVELSKPFVEVLKKYVADNPGLAYEDLGEFLEDLIRRGWMEVRKR